MAREMKTGHSYCMRIDVRGLLSRKPAEFRRACGGFTNDDGTRPTPDQVREFLFDHLSQGHEFIPAGRCDNWDWKDGCMGHPDGKPGTRVGAVDPPAPEPRP